MPASLVRLWAILLIAGLGCAEREPTPSLSAMAGSRTMPTPTGCYVLLAAAPELSGVREYVNGPVKYFSLGNLPFGADWRQRARSVSVGPAATLTVWTDEGYQGTSMTFDAGRRYPQLPTEFDRAVESLAITCLQK